jgi:hypothetical protein
VLVTTNFYSCIAVSHAAGVVMNGLLVTAVILYLSIKGVELDWENIFAFILLGLVCISFAPALFVHNQDPVKTFSCSLVMFELLLIPFFKRISPTSKEVLAVIIVSGMLWLLLTIGQQITFPRFFFATRMAELDENGNGMEMRNGMVRFMIEGYIYAILMACWAVHGKMLGIRREYLVRSGLLVMVFVSLFVSGSRTGMICLLLSLIVNSVIGSGRKRNPIEMSIISCAILALLGAVGMLGRNISVGGLEFESISDNVRMKTYSFFLNDFWNGWFTFFFGNGASHSDTSYGELMRSISMRGFFLSDVGVVGLFILYGAVFVVFSFGFLMMLVKKYWSREEKTASVFFLYNIFGAAILMPYYPTLLCCYALTLCFQKTHD